jgi:hypothetical protein
VDPWQAHLEPGISTKYLYEHASVKFGHRYSFFTPLAATM